MNGPGLIQYRCIGDSNKRDTVMKDRIAVIAEVRIDIRAVDSGRLNDRDRIAVRSGTVTVRDSQAYIIPARLSILMYRVKDGRSGTITKIPAYCV